MPAKRKAVSQLNGSGWLDVSLPYREGMVTWPDDPPFHMSRTRDMNRGGQENVSHVSLSVHSGTHMDAPLHYFKYEAGLEELPFDTVIGPARVIEIKNRKCITPEELEPHRIRCGDRVLFKTRNSARCYRTDAFVKDYVYLTQAAARLLAGAAVRLVGIDYLSVGGFPDDNTETHQELLKAGIWIIEGLNLSNIKPGMHDMICLPLGLMHADGAPARVILRPQDAR